MPGSTHPDDWGTTEEEITARLVDAFRSGFWAIDWWEGDPREEVEEEEAVGRGLFVRPAIAGCAFIHHPAWGGKCTFLRENSCALAPGARPFQCRMLEPRDGHERCVEHDGAGKQELAVAWIPFHAAIEAAAAASDR